MAETMQDRLRAAADRMKAADAAKEAEAEAELEYARRKQEREGLSR